MKYIDITPAEFRCPVGDCPSVERAEDGSSYQITGKNVPTNPYIGGEATVEIDARLLEGALGVHSVTDSSGDVFADLGLDKEQSLIAIIQKRDEQLAAADRINAASSRSAKEMLERIAALETALKPFADIFDWLEADAKAIGQAPPNDDLAYDADLMPGVVVIGNLRRARAALSKDKGDV